MSNNVDANDDISSSDTESSCSDDAMSIWSDFESENDSESSDFDCVSPTHSNTSLYVPDQPSTSGKAA